MRSSPRTGRGWRASRLATRSQEAYAAQVARFLTWLVSSEHAARALSDHHVRDWAVRDYKRHVKVGVPVNGRPGTHAFTVRASGPHDARATSTVTYTVKPREPSKGAEIVITRPADGATYESGTRIRAQYSCTNARECQGDVKVGVPVNGRPGTHVFTVRASGPDGAPATSTATYTVRPGVPSRGPEVVITTPVDNASYASGSAILADYDCTNARSCTGDVQRGEAIDGDPGPHEFTVRGTGSDGTSIDRTVTYTVTSATPDPLTVEASVIEPQRTSPASAYRLAYSCSGGTAPLKCTATLDGVAAEPGATITCGSHAVIVRATDAANAEQKQTFTLNGPPCPVLGPR